MVKEVCIGSELSEAKAEARGPKGQEQGMGLFGEGQRGELEAPPAASVAQSGKKLVLVYIGASKITIFQSS